MTIFFFVSKHFRTTLKFKQLNTTLNTTALFFRFLLLFQFPFVAISIKIKSNQLRNIQ